jgi:hypothetical protein
MKEEFYVILHGANIKADGTVDIPLVTDTRPQSLYLLEYEIRDANNTAGVADDMFLLLNCGELRGGNVTFAAVGMNTGSNDLVLSTNAALNSGIQRFQEPVLIAENSMVGRRRIHFKIRDEAGAPYVPALVGFRIMLRFCFTQETHSLTTMKLTSRYASQAWAHAGN